jgi:drug/metabolite transporter (DMT)-like permease
MIARIFRTEKQRFIAAGLMVLLAALWAIAELLPTFLTPGYSLYQVVWVRYITHIVCMLLVLLPRHGLGVFHTQRPALQIGRGLLMVVMPASFIASIGQASGYDVLAVFWLTPLLLLAFAALLQGDRPNWLVWCAAGASALGAQLILRPTATALAAVPYGLGMAVSFSLYVVLTRTLRTERTMTNLLYSALVVAVPLTFVMPAVWQPLTLRDGLIMAGVGVVGLAVLWIIDRVSDLLPISVFASLFSLQLVLMAVVLPLVAGARPAKLALAGTLLVLGAACAGWFVPRKPQSSESETVPVLIKAKHEV